MRHGALKQICFVLCFLGLSPQRSLVRDNSEKVKAWEKSGGGRTTIIAVVLYFFLLWDAPRSPSVLIGSGGLLYAGRADVNRAWRTSAAGTNIPTLLHPKFSALQNNLIYAWQVKRSHHLFRHCIKAGWSFTSSWPFFSLSTTVNITVSVWR